jgi:pilus assembly protein FimV
MAKRKPNQHNRLHMAVLAGIASINAHAIGIGEIEVRSRLNEPLHADVPLIELQPNDLDLAQVRFHAINLDATGSTNSSIVANLSGRFVAGKNGYKLEIRSNENIREPIVSFYVEVILPNAHARREFTVLLDPPDIAAVNSAPAAKRPDHYDFEAMENSINTLSVAPGTARNRKVRAPEVAVVEQPAAADSSIVSEQPKRANVASTQRTHADAVAKPASRKHKAAVTEASNKTTTPGRNVYGPVQKNETLWAIARKVRPNRSVPMLDTMQKLLAENPHAFVNNDMNRLRVGVSLNIPELDASNSTADVAATATSSPATSIQPSASASADIPAATTGADSAAPAASNSTAVVATGTNQTLATDSTKPATADAAAKPSASTDTSTHTSLATAAGNSTTVASGAQSVASASAATAENQSAQPTPNATSTDPGPLATASAMTEQAAAMQARLDTLAQQLEAVQRRLSEREDRIATLEGTLEDLNTRLQNTQAQANPAATTSTQSTTPSAAASTQVNASPAQKTPASPQATSSAASYAGVRLPSGAWVWGMSAAAIAAGLGAAFMARRRRTAGVKHGLPFPAGITSAAMPPKATASSIVAASATTHGEIAIDQHIRTQIIAPPAAAATPSAVTTVDVDLHQPATGDAAVSTSVVDGDGAAFPTSPDGNIAWDDETVPNWSLERTIERTLEQTGETLVQTQTETFLKNGAEATAAATDAKSDNKVVPLKLDSSRVEPVLKEVDLQMAYLQFDDAERLLMTPLQESPNEPSLLVKLAEVHVAAGNIDKFVDLAVRLSKIPEVRNGDDWKKIARMGEMVAPNHPLFEFVATVEITRDEFGNIATRA